MKGSIEVGAQTGVSIDATGYDKRPESEGGCGKSGCEPDLAHDGIVADPQSRWSCSKKLVPSGGQCVITFTFEDRQNMVGLDVSFFKGDERRRKLKVRAVHALNLVS